MAATVLALLLLLGVAGPIIAVREASLRQKADMLAERELSARTETYRSLYVADMRLANQAWEKGDIKLLTELLRRHQHPGSGQQDLRGFEWYYLAKRLQEANETPILLHDLAVRSVAYSADGSTIAVATGSTVRLSGTLIPGSDDEICPCVRNSPCLRRFFTARQRTVGSGGGQQGSAVEHSHRK